MMSFIIEFKSMQLTGMNGDCTQEKGPFNNQETFDINPPSVKQYYPLCQWKKILIFAGVLFVGVGLGYPLGVELGYPLGRFNKKSNVENATSNTENTINSDDAFLADYTDEKLSTIVTIQEADNKLNILESYRKTLEQNKNIIIERIENIKSIIQDGMEERLLAEEINNLSKEEEEILKYYEKTDQEYLDFLKKKEDMLILKNKIEKELEETCSIAQKSEEEKEKIKNQMAIVKEKQKALEEKKARIKKKEN
jgi:hypothetical protein